MDVAELAVDGLAAYRLTRLVTADVITQDLRHAVIRDAYRRADAHDEIVDDRRWDKIADDFGPADRADGETLEDAVARDPDAPKVATLVTCRWCTGVWVAAGVVVARRVAPRVWDPVARAAALAAVAVLAARAEDD